jgi:ribonuclease R
MSEILTGKFALLRSGDGIVRVNEGEEEIFIPRWATGTALPGDIVQVSLLSQRTYRKTTRKHERRAGKIIAIIHASERELVGTLISKGGQLLVVPLDPLYSRHFKVKHTKGAKIGSRVVIRCGTKRGSKSALPAAEIIDVIGPSTEPSVDTLSVIRNYNLPQRFTDDVIREAEIAGRRADNPGSRTDLRDLLVFTIDPATARDFDDAISLERDSNGNRVLGVHIADVSHFVRPETKLDIEARRRGNSVYLPDMVIPMLPEQLSNGICSLCPGEDRLTFSVFVTFDNEGHVINRHFCKSIIRSSRRFTYEEVMAELNELLQGKRTPDRFGEKLLQLNELAQQLRRQRFENGALNLDTPDCEVLLDEKGNVSSIRLVQNDLSHQIIEECMIAANRAVAEELSERDVPAIYRIHESPSSEQYERMMQALEEMGFRPGNVANRKILSRFLLSLSNTPLTYVVRLTVLKCLMRATYSAKLRGHYGLALKKYLHFTSPIRRYPDLIVHRQLARALNLDDGELLSRKQLHEIAHNCTITEEKAELAERELTEIKKYRFLEQQMDTSPEAIHQAVIIGEGRAGTMVELSDFMISAILITERQSQDFRKIPRGKKSYKNTSFKHGTKINVKLVEVNLEQRYILVQPA